MRSYLFLMMALALLSCATKPTAEIVVYGKIWTGDERKPLAEAMAINADTIVAVGTRSEIESYVGKQTQVLEGKFIAPGFIDTHTHFVDGGFRLQSVLLRDAKTP